MANDLWAEVLETALSLGGRATKFRRDLDNFIAFRERCFGDELSYDTISFEEFVGYLDIEHQLGLRGSDTWSDEGNESQIATKKLIGHILTERTPVPENVPNLYLEFARKLQPDDIVITFNYDILLERALDAVAVPYRLFSQRYSEVRTGTATVDSSQDEVIILKMHGSVDWFDRSHYQNALEYGQSIAGTDYEPSHPIFNSSSRFTTKRIVDGPRFDGDPLSDIYRVEEVENVYQEPIMFMVTPALIAPSTSKLTYAARMKDYWYGLAHAGTFNFRMVIIGYSLPEHDSYLQQVVYSLIDNYQRRGSADDGEILGLTKEPLLLVDYRQNQAELDEYESRYAFVDWDQTVLLTDGFNEDVLGHLE